MKLPNIKFIVQIANGCCPAAINIVLQYYGNNEEYVQETYLNLLGDYSKANDELSFFKSAKCVYSTKFKGYNFECFDFHNLSEWKNNVKSYLDDEIPVIISSKII